MIDQLRSVSTHRTIYGPSRRKLREIHSLRSLVPIHSPESAFRFVQTDLLTRVFDHPASRGYNFHGKQAIPVDTRFAHFQSKVAGAARAFHGTPENSSQKKRPVNFVNRPAIIRIPDNAWSGYPWC